MRATVFALLLTAIAAPVTAEPSPPKPYVTAVAFKERPAEAVALDASRKPAQILAFMKLKPGMKALDVISETGYYAELMSRVVGPKGNVTAYEPAAMYKDKGKIVLDAVAARQPNLKISTDPAIAMAPASYDFAMIHLNYHDFYWESAQYGIPRVDPDMVLKALYGAMKPGGIVAVVDHVGPAGDTRAIVDKLHRIDPATAKADFARAGFVLEAESPLLHMASDDHNKLVFDPAVRGKTDRFVLRYRKPVK